MALSLCGSFVKVVEARPSFRAYLSVVIVNSSMWLFYKPLAANFAKDPMKVGRLGFCSNFCSERSPGYSLPGPLLEMLRKQTMYQCRTWTTWYLREMIWLIISPRLTEQSEGLGWDRGMSPMGFSSSNFSHSHGNGMRKKFFLKSLIFMLLFMFTSTWIYSAVFFLKAATVPVKNMLCESCRQTSLQSHF